MGRAGRQKQDGGRVSHVVAGDPIPRNRGDTGARTEIPTKRQLNRPMGGRQMALSPPSVAHEAGELNDLPAILGNDIAITAYRGGALPFPEGTIIARAGWDYVPSEGNDKVFGRPQSFVAGAPKEGVQFMVKDSTKYASTGGWGFAQFNDGKPVDAAMLKACFLCHEPAKHDDHLHALCALRNRIGPRIKSCSANVFSSE